MHILYSSKSLSSPKWIYIEHSMPRQSRFLQRVNVARILATNHPQEVIAAHRGIFSVASTHNQVAQFVAQNVRAFNTRADVHAELVNYGW